MNIVLIDDDEVFLNIFKKQVKIYARQLFDNINIDISTDISILNNKLYSIYFLDIDLIDQNGIDIAKEIKKINKNAKIIFTTAKNELVYNAISIQPFYFIRKSDLDSDLATAFILLKDYFKKKKYYSFKYDTEIIKVYIDDIIYIETSDHLTTLFTESKQFNIYKPLRTVLNEIDSPLIIQANRKQCINLLHITQKKRNILQLDNLVNIKIGNKYKSNLLNKFNEFISDEDNYGI